ncbi:hypothetical protein CKA32_001970 [Geitlerinema sp. FC II]|nr:hypothetical protein [Baaleninema simplex]MDC0834390.1 hypothetical protein [Geitlerinema sp. CS-897]PPT09548.1 hypothetical protein CKA32_001970 [Geitlerinema sp. FC II]
MPDRTDIVSLLREYDARSISEASCNRLDRAFAKITDHLED